MTDETLDRFKKFWFDGLLATHDLQELAKDVSPSGPELVALSKATEGTDPTWYPPDLIASANRMAEVYLRLYLFENRARRLVEKVLAESHGKEWYEKAVPSSIRAEAANRKKREGTARFHGHRGDRPLYYVNLSDLGKIIEVNWDEFEEILYRRDWVLGKFEELRLTRNAVAHMGDVSEDDLSRLDMTLKDWNRQIG